MNQSVLKLLEKLDRQLVLSVVGPTATGKTQLALEIARWLLEQRSSLDSVEIISADSRQVYADLPIVSGADLPALFEPKKDSALPYSYYAAQLGDDREIRLHGLNILEAKKSWSVVAFQRLVQTVMSLALSQASQVILVGGTGLYHTQVFNQELAEVAGPNQQLRQELEQLSVLELKAKLAESDPERLAAMNQSDRANPRRLVRALEQAGSATGQSDQQQSQQSGKQKLIMPADHFKICLSANLADIEAKIEKRIKERLEAGAVDEVRALLTKFGGFDQASIEALLADEELKKWPILSATGVRELAAYLAGQVDLETASANWLTRERQYARAQQTWWRARPVDLELQTSK